MSTLRRSRSQDRSQHEQCVEVRWPMLVVLLLTSLLATTVLAQPPSCPAGVAASGAGSFEATACESAAAVANVTDSSAPPWFVRARGAFGGLATVAIERPSVGNGRSVFVGRRLLGGDAAHKSGGLDNLRLGMTVAGARAPTAGPKARPAATLGVGLRLRFR